MLLTHSQPGKFIILHIEIWEYINETFFHDKSMRIILSMVLMLFLCKYKFKYVMYKHICIVSKFYWQKFLLSILLTNDKALANKADRVKKMPIEYLHFSLINF